MTKAESTARALKTLCGAVYYIISRYDSHLGISTNEVYCIDTLTPKGFLMSTRVLSIRYEHSDFHQQCGTDNVLG